MNGSSVSSFDPGITMNSATVTDASHATANITISSKRDTGDQGRERDNGT